MGFQQGFRINTNTAALDTYRSYTASQAGLERNIERLSSGLRINRAADDAAGLSISNRMDNQVRGMQQANRNVQQGNNMLQTAEGGAAGIGGLGSELLLDTQQLVVLGDPVGSRRRARLDLTGVRGHGYVGDRRVFRLPGAMRDDGGIPGAMGHVDGGERLGERADLVDFH